MNIIPIKTETDYNKALKRLETIFTAEIGTPESDEADILGLLIEIDENWKIQTIMVLLDILLLIQLEIIL